MATTITMYLITCHKKWQNVQYLLFHAHSKLQSRRIHKCWAWFKGIKFKLLFIRRNIILIPNDQSLLSILQIELRFISWRTGHICKIEFTILHSHAPQCKQAEKSTSDWDFSDLLCFTLSNQEHWKSYTYWTPSSSRDGGHSSLFCLVAGIEVVCLLADIHQQNNLQWVAQVAKSSLLGIISLVVLDTCSKWPKVFPRSLIITMHTIDLLRQLCLRTDTLEQLIKSSDHDLQLRIFRRSWKREKSDI